ncbi:MAG: 30S ribosomal protein S3 [Chloroflexi bacterium B3_Chlor]|nr:MAG: 30S ribosomal protein S3 [Chloroflexi bacterium B3_Chlor]
MGRKVHPVGFRLGVTKDWKAKWFAEGQEYADLLREDLELRQLIRNKMAHAGIARIDVERFPKQVSLTIHTARPGIVIGRKGVSVNLLRRQVEDLTAKKARIEVVEVPEPELNAYLIAESISAQLARRISHKRAMKQAASRAMRLGAGGIKIACSGRLAGSEMGRRDWTMEGRVPLHTLRADIDYAQSEALTTYGRIGVKVWVYKGDVFPEEEEAADSETFLQEF